MCQLARVLIELQHFVGVVPHFCLYLSSPIHLMHPTYLYLLLFSFQTLYKTQIRELKEECDEKNKLYKDAEQQIDEYQKDRCEFIY